MLWSLLMKSVYELQTTVCLHRVSCLVGLTVIQVCTPAHELRGLNAKGAFLISPKPPFVHFSTNILLVNKRGD